MSEFAIVDDQSPLVAYNNVSHWFDFADQNAWNSTLSLTNVSGSTVSFQFRGTQIAVVGSVLISDGSPHPVKSAYSIDGTTPAQYTAPSADSEQQTFFISPTLADGLHQLKITVLGNGPNFYLDYIAFVPSVTTTQAGATVVTTVFASASATGAPLSHDTTSGSSSTPIGPIVGGVVSGVVVLIAAALAFYFFYWKQRNRHRYASAALDDAFVDMSEVTPFTQSPPTFGDPPAVAVSGSHYSVTSPPSSVTQSGTAPVPYDPITSVTTYPPRQRSTGAPSVASSASRYSNRSLVVTNYAPDDIPPAPTLTPAQRKAAEAASQAQTEIVQQHHDSGVRFDATGQASGSSSRQAPELVEVPPEYTPS